jgi:hypothetical protein
MANSEWRMVNENPQLATLNPQPDFGANAPPTRQFHAFTLPTHNFKRDMGQGTRDKTAAISEW